MNLNEITYDDVINLWKSTPTTENELDIKLNNYRILFAYNSNKIENPNTSYHDTREIFENAGLCNYTGDLRTIFEIQNQKKCYEFLREKIIHKAPINIELIKETHKILTIGTYDDRRYNINGERPGEFKKHDYSVGRNDVGTPPEYVEEDLAALLGDMDGVDKEANFKALNAAAYFHASFEFIHPFSDGNGRVGRTLMNYYLMINDHPPLIVYDEDKNGYYDALEEFDNNEDLSPLIDFLKKQCAKTWRNSVSRARRSLEEAENDDTYTLSDHQHGRR